MIKPHFKHIAKLVRTSRLKAGITQQELARTLGFANGQYISNCERAYSSIPKDKINVLSRKLGIKSKKVVAAILADKRIELLNEIGRRK